jgi:hypothetical protein
MLNALCEEIDLLLPLEADPIWKVLLWFWTSYKV